MATRVVTVNDILDGHVGLDLECFDRIYLNGWVPNLQVSGQVVGFLTAHLGFPIPSPAILEKIGLRFRRAVDGLSCSATLPARAMAWSESTEHSSSSAAIACRRACRSSLQSRHIWSSIMGGHASA